MDNKNLILAIVCSVAILFTFQFVSERLYPKPAVPPPSQTAAPAHTGTGSGAPPAPASEQGAVPAAAGGGGVPAPTGVGATESRSEVLTGSPRVHIQTPSLHGSIALVGGRIDDVTLVN